ncbi:MAG: TonB-dependent receptor [Telluria sp.]
MKSCLHRLTAPRLKAIPAALLGLAACHPAAWGGESNDPATGATPIATVLVAASPFGALGASDSASVGTVTRAELEARTVYRPAELMESTPGLIVSQHSGEGKANQFYLRGFNLDHGTDLRTTVDGMLVNQRSHAHGQGWTDLNFLMPELSVRMEYKKGPYFASEGDFASAGAVSVVYADVLSKGVVSGTIGSDGYQRAVIADSPRLGGGRLLYALEAEHNDGPFRYPENFRKINGVLRYSEGGSAQGFNVTAMAYHGSWMSTDQIPQRAIDTGFVRDRFDTIDPTDGGGSHRYSLSTAWHRANDGGVAKANAYVIDNRLALFSNFTYFLDDPVNGDQFAQPDQRITSGANASYRWDTKIGGYEGQTTVGVQLQNDNIHNGLYSTRAQQQLSTTRTDHIVESSAGVYLENATSWMPGLRTIAGVRLDRYWFDVTSNLAANSGSASAGLASPKLNIVFGPWHETEYYLNFGRGFHSNDARGTTISVDPKSGAPADRVTPLVRSQGYEIGARTQLVPNLQASLTFYRLDFDSELVFAGDAGATEAGRPSRRQGFEVASAYKLDKWLTLDANFAFAHARFRGDAPEGNHIPGAVEGVASVALAIDNRGPFFGALQFRYFGGRPLREDDRVRSRSTSTLNARLGYKISPRWSVELEGFNLTNRSDSAIDYYYTSRLPGEPAAGVDDVHLHPIESRSYRLTLIGHF